MKGYISHQLQNCIETSNRYILLVNWVTLENHVEGFKDSKEYQEWKSLLHHFYDPFPTVKHFNQVTYKNK
jgi:heme-degrading monooxygenase HmoA